MTKWPKKFHLTLFPSNKTCHAMQLIYLFTYLVGSEAGSPVLGRSFCQVNDSGTDLQISQRRSLLGNKGAIGSTSCKTLGKGRNSLQIIQIRCCTFKFWQHLWRIQIVGRPKRRRWACGKGCWDKSQCWPGNNGGERHQVEDDGRGRGCPHDYAIILLQSQKIIVVVCFSFLIAEQIQNEMCVVCVQIATVMPN